MRRIVYAACGVTLMIGLFFVFVWAPHPWGWEGFDHYHQLALVLAHGGGFPTLDVPWGYAGFLAAFYRLFGDHPAIPLVAQVALNASVPLLTFLAAREWVGERAATLAAVLIGVFSFNTVYASTQSSDAVCTVLFMAAVAAFVKAYLTDRWPCFAVAGVLTGIAPQFRPNLILVPVVLAAYAVGQRRTRRRAIEAVVLLAGATAALSPWVIRNYRLTATLLPTSVHGGVQLWYGSLQVGPYLHSRAYNPRSVFEGPVFEYTSLADVPIVMSADITPCIAEHPTSTDAIYWTDRDPTRRRAHSSPGGALEMEIAAPHQSMVLYYFFESRCPEDQEPRKHVTPSAGEAGPFVFFVSQDHLGDLDVHGDLLDAFDIVRMIRRDAWNEPLSFADRLEAAGVDRLVDAVAALMPVPATGRVSLPAPRLSVAADRATMALPDGSSIVMPRVWTGRITDLMFEGGLALALMHSSASLGDLSLAHQRGLAVAGRARGERDDVAINRVFYRLEPHLMRRYSALAFDNIRRTPLSFAAACVFRATRLFIVSGSTDVHTAQQFDKSRRIYALATIASIASLVLFAVGAIAAWRRRHDVALPLLLVAYLPATISPFLTNMRYSITVQPLMFVFIAVALERLLAHAPTPVSAGSQPISTHPHR